VFVSAAVGLVYYYYDSRSAIHKHVIMPIIRSTLDAEDSHVLGVKSLAAPAWMRPVDKGVDGEELQMSVSSG
jgi:dihydroorotate dehydrogenase